MSGTQTAGNPNVTFPGGLMALAVTTVDPTTGQPVSPGGGGSGSNPSLIYSGQQTTTAGAVALPSQALTNGIVIKALTSNTGTVYVGPSGVSAANGYPLKAGESISYGVSNLNAVFIIGTNTTDIVAFTGN